MNDPESPPSSEHYVAAHANLKTLIKTTQHESRTQAVKPI